MTYIFLPMQLGVTVVGMNGELRSREHSIAAVAVLGDDLRRRMYEYIRHARRPVTRDEAAGSVGISRKLAAFHLDKLVAAGLLRAGYERQPGGRTLGRTPKVYQPADIQLQVAIPDRRHDLLAGILLDAIDAPGPPTTAALRVARQRGVEMGAAERERSRPGRLGTERALTLAAGVIERYGYEPHRPRPTELRLGNCPFHPLAAKSPELVCGINQAFLCGLLTGLHAGTVEAVLAPTAGECCVRLRQTGR